MIVVEKSWFWKIMGSVALSMVTVGVITLVIQPQSVKAQDAKTQDIVTRIKEGHSLTQRIEGLTAQLDQLRKAPNPPAGQTACYSTVNLALSVIDTDIDLGKTTIAKVEPSVRKLEELLKSNTLTEGNNCNNWLAETKAALKN